MRADERSLFIDDVLLPHVADVRPLRRGALPPPPPLRLRFTWWRCCWRPPPRIVPRAVLARWPRCALRAMLRLARACEGIVVRACGGWPAGAAASRELRCCSRPVGDAVLRDGVLAALAIGGLSIRCACAIAAFARFGDAAIAARARAFALRRPRCPRRRAAPLAIHRAARRGIGASRLPAALYTSRCAFARCCASRLVRAGASMPRRSIDWRACSATAVRSSPRRWIARSESARRLENVAAVAGRDTARRRD
jgi:hypothetical protein